MTSLSDDNHLTQPHRYLDDLFDIENPYFEEMVNQIYPPELQLNKTYTSDNKAPFLNFHLSISKRLVPPKFMINTMNFLF